MSDTNIINNAVQSSLVLKFVRLQLLKHLPNLKKLYAKIKLLGGLKHFQNVWNY